MINLLILFEYIHLSIIDVVLVIMSFLISVLISYQDWTKGKFSFWLWLMLTLFGGVWCVVQSFIPLALVPVGIGMIGIMAINRWIKPVMGEGDILLFLSSSLFIPIIELGTFLILCGIAGMVIFGIKRYQKKESLNKIPFAPAILSAIWLTLLIYMV